MFKPSDVKLTNHLEPDLRAISESSRRHVLANVLRDELSNGPLSKQTLAVVSALGYEDLLATPKGVVVSVESVTAPSVRRTLHTSLSQKVETPVLGSLEDVSSYVDSHIESDRKMGDALQKKSKGFFQGLSNVLAAVTRVKTAPCTEREFKEAGDRIAQAYEIIKHLCMIRFPTPDQTSERYEAAVSAMEPHLEAIGIRYSHGRVFKRDDARPFTHCDIERSGIHRGAWQGYAESVKKHTDAAEHAPELCLAIWNSIHKDVEKVRMQMVRDPEDPTIIKHVPVKYTVKRAIKNSDAVYLFGHLTDLLKGMIRHDYVIMMEFTDSARKMQAWADRYPEKAQWFK